MATTRQDAPEHIDALRAALIAERARTAQVEAELAIAKAKASDDAALIAHQRLQIEKLSNLAALPRPFGFQVLALPIHLERASGAWARVVALVPR